MSSPFRDEGERLRAREAAYETLAAFGYPGAIDEYQQFLDKFDEHYPPIVDAPRWPEMSGGSISGTMPDTLAFNATPTPPDFGAAGRTLQALHDAATPGPWVAEPDDGLECYRVVRDTPEWRRTQGCIAEVVVESLGQNTNEHNDAEFIAACRDGVPALLAELTRLRAEVEALREANDMAERTWPPASGGSPAVTRPDSPHGGTTASQKDSDWRHTMTDRGAPSPDALDAAGVLSPEQFARLLGYYRSGRGGEYDAAGDTLLAHDAAVRRLAEQGEVMEVIGHRYHSDGRPTLTVAGLYGEEIQTGTFVRVTRKEES